MTIKLTPTDIGKFYKARLSNDTTIKVVLVGWDYSMTPAVFVEIGSYENLRWWTNENGRANGNVNPDFKILHEWEN